MQTFKNHKLFCNYTIHDYIVSDITPAAGDDIYWTEDTGADVLTLITCYPLNFVGKAEERFIVRGELVN